jgi:hypothetical protein
LTAAADARQTAEWSRALGLAAMVSSLWNGTDPREVVPKHYRPAPPRPREPTPAEREAAIEIGLANMGAALRQMTGGQ